MSENQSVPVPETQGRGTGTPAAQLFGDVASLLDGTLPDPPEPEVLKRNDGRGIFYRDQLNIVFGEAETGKTLIAMAALKEVLEAGGKAVVLDLDHNSMRGIVTKLLDIGTSPDLLRDPARFLYAEPEDKPELWQMVQYLKAWRPDLAVVDSVGELMPMMGLNSNNPDDFTLAHTGALKPLVMTGACVIGIDHLAKGEQSRKQGPIGTTAKRRAVGGVMLRVTVDQQFTPGLGGSAYINIFKDRHGGLRRGGPQEAEPLAAKFKMSPEGNCKIYAPQEGERTPQDATAEELEELLSLDPAAAGVRDIKTRLNWGSDKAARVWRVYQSQRPALERSRSSSVPQEQEQTPGSNGVPVPQPPMSGTGTADETEPQLFDMESAQ